LNGSPPSTSSMTNRVVFSTIGNTDHGRRRDFILTPFFVTVCVFESIIIMSPDTAPTFREKYLPFVILNTLSGAPIFPVAVISIRAGVAEFPTVVHSMKSTTELSCKGSFAHSFTPPYVPSVPVFVFCAKLLYIGSSVLSSVTVHLHAIHFISLSYSKNSIGPLTFTFRVHSESYMSLIYRTRGTRELVSLCRLNIFCRYCTASTSAMFHTLWIIPSSVMTRLRANVGDTRRPWYHAIFVDVSSVVSLRHSFAE